MAQEITNLREQLNTLKQVAGDTHARDDGRDGIATQQLREERQRCLELQCALDEAKATQAQAAQQVAKLQQSEENFLRAQRNTEELNTQKSRANATPATVPEAAALAIFGDLELGRSGTTLTELGLGDLQSLHCADRALQSLAVLMAWRSDLRMAVFGMWLLCHLVYVVNIFYEHLLQHMF